MLRGHEGGGDGVPLVEALRCWCIPSAAAAGDGLRGLQQQRRVEGRPHPLRAAVAGWSGRINRTQIGGEKLVPARVGQRGELVGWVLERGWLAAEEVSPRGERKGRDGCVWPRARHMQSGKLI